MVNFVLFTGVGGVALLALLVVFMWPIIRSPYPFLLAMMYEITLIYSFLSTFTQAGITVTAYDVRRGSRGDLDQRVDCNGGVDSAVVVRVSKVSISSEGNRMIRKIQLALIFTFLVVLVVPGTALAKGLHEDEIVFGGTYTLESGETLDGSLIVFGGSAALEESSQVQGDVVIFGGTLDAQGEITGSVVGIGGSVTLDDTASVGQDVVIFGANLDQALGAEVGGNVIDEITSPLALKFPGRYARSALPGFV